MEIVTVVVCDKVSEGTILPSSGNWHVAFQVVIAKHLLEALRRHICCSAIEFGS